MNYSNFVEALLKKLTEQYPDWNCSIQSICRANEVNTEALVVLPPRQTDGIGISSAVFLEPFYRSYLEGTDFQRILEEISHCIDRFAENPPVKSCHSLASYPSMKPHTIFRIVNPEANRQLLGNIPHRIIGEFAVIYYLIFFSEITESTWEDAPYIATSMITNRHLALWGITEDNLFHDAMEQTPKLLPPHIATMTAILEELCSQEEMKHVSPQNDCPMWVLTNTYRLYGAACILYPGLLSECAGLLGGNFYILPSSVHEVILIPLKESHHISREELLEMVREINHSAVLDEERLADNVYLYDESTGHISSE